MYFVWHSTIAFFLAIDVVSSQNSYDVRIVDGENVGGGTVQVWYDRQWKTYCKRWGSEEYTVTCRQLGFPDEISQETYRDPSRTYYSGGVGYGSKYHFNCAGSEKNLSSCSLGCCDYSNCESVFINCSSIRQSLIRLVGGSSANKGRVELWTGYKWMPIVKSSWTSSEANVTCKQLGYIDGALTYGSSSGYTETRYGQSKSTTCSQGAECSGLEPTLNDCKNHITSSYCPHSNDVSVECHPNRQTIECHCLTSFECDRSDGSCPDGQCSTGWAGDYCQLELPRLSSPPRINGTVVRWDEWSPEHDIGTGPVIGYSIYYVDTSQFGYEEEFIADVETTSHRLSNLPPGRMHHIGISCLIKTESVTSVGPLSPTVNFTTSTGQIDVDFVLLNFNPVIEFDNVVSSLNIGGYTIGEYKTNNINFGRRHHNGTGVNDRELGWLDDGVLSTSNSMFPIESTVSQIIRNDVKAMLLHFPDNSNAENIGAFYSWSTAGRLSSNITTFTISKEANVRSKSTTTVAGVGERVELLMEIEDNNMNIDKLRWRHNSGEILSDWNGKTKLIIDSVRTKDGGIYECYFDGEKELGLQGVTQLIVRGCPLPKWGVKCDNDCPVCYNGGVCHPTTGACVCPSGYMGDSCSKPCGDNSWGRNCSVVCSSSYRGCDGILFCLPEPMGCSCMAGYKGHNCEQLCPYGTFGADCKSTCHCKFSACSRSMGCANVTCDDGFTGPQCQEYEDSTPCPDGFYGTLCQYRCHCSGTVGCYKNGTCPLACQEGWGGGDCQFAIPALRNPPRISKSNFYSLHLEWDEWRIHDDYGLGDVTGYRLFYRYITPSPGAQRAGEYTNGTKLILSQLNPCRRYEMYIRVYTNISGELVGGRPSPTVYHDMACNYESVEVTIMAQPAVVDADNKTEDVDIAVYSGALSMSIQLGRTCDTGTGNTGRPVSWFDGSPFPGSHVLPTMAFPKNTLIETIVTYDYHALIAKIPGDSYRPMAKGGVFSAEILGTWALPSKSTVIVLDKDAKPMPIERSIVVGTGDRAVLSVIVDGNTTALRWRHNGGTVIKQWNDKRTVVIEHARTKDSGIYECYLYAERNLGTHAIIQLNVKECPLSKHGPACDLDCPVCYNGGVCDSVTSLCICPSGFTGSDCSEVCKAGYWGKDCSLNCNDEENGCLGNLFCPATPLGCSCLPGFHGLGCNEVCSEGFYGADCKQVCNCPSSSCDPVSGCSTGSCLTGYGGPQCQEHTNVPCSNGTFGPLCNHHCHCKQEESCLSNGTCAHDVCADGWAGQDCQIALPYLMHGAMLSVSINRREISVSWFDWTFGRDFGTGPVVSYEIFYTDSTNGDYKLAGRTTTTDFRLTKLKPGKQYNVVLKCLKKVDGLLVSGPASPTSAVSTCKLSDL